jgi:apolipoprotein N-acyltransferase
VGLVALLQPDVGVKEKWDPAQQDSIFHATLDLSDKALVATEPRLMVWPEAAVTWLPRWPSWEAALASQAATYGVPLVIGGLDLEFDESGGYEYWNAAFVFDSSGARTPYPVYHKRYLVPIVERVPFVNPRWFSGMQHFGGFGVGALGSLYRVGPDRYGIIICYESAYEDLSRRYRRLGADFIVNITNDAWFGRSSAPYQHFSHLVMRAIENRVGIARSANNGVSGFIDPLGRPYSLTSLGDRGFVADTLMTSDSRTWYTRLGDWVALFSLLGTAVMVGLAWRGRP